jgi:hypothetical protein
MEEIVVRVPPGRVRVKDGRCPNGCDLMDAAVQLSGVPSIKVEVSVEGRRAPLHLNSLYGMFDFRCSLALEPGQVVEVFCPSCGVSLSDPTSTCSICKIPMFAVRLLDGGQVEACPKVGCHNHKLVVMNLDALLGRIYDDDTKPMM